MSSISLSPADVLAEASALHYCALATGSGGNAHFVWRGTDHILIDAGLSRREIFTRLAKIGKRPSNIDLIAVTHEHRDHYGCADSLADWLNVSLLDNRPYRSRVSLRAAHVYRMLQMCPVSVDHDAEAPVGYRFGDQLGIFVDCGTTRNIPTDVDTLVIDCNYDLDMLMASSYRPALRRRIAGEHGHLSNDDVARFVEAAGSPWRRLILAHLSSEANNIHLARAVVQRAIDRVGGRTELVVLAPGEQSIVFTITQ